MNAAAPPPDDEALLVRVREAAEELRRELNATAAGLASVTEYAAAARVDAALNRCLDALAATGAWGEANRVASSELWRIAGSVLECGWLQNHARTKPRGYAGDWEMLAKIAENWRCEHRLGRHFDAFFQSQAAPEAVRARIELCGVWVAEGCAASQQAFRVASIGSGPGLDLVHAARLLPDKERARLAVTLLDLDEEALAVAAKNLALWLAAERVTAVRSNLFRLAQRPKELGGPYDAMLCTGLFDYLAPPAASGLMRVMWEALVPGGWMVVGNFSPANPTRAYMEWIGNWYLKHRTAEELAAIAEQAGISRAVVSVTTERTGVNLLLRATKQGLAGRI